MPLIPVPVKTNEATHTLDCLFGVAVLGVDQTTIRPHRSLERSLQQCHFDHVFKIAHSQTTDPGREDETNLQTVTAVT